MAPLLVAEMAEKINSGKPIPMPKARKFRIFRKKFMLDMVFVNSTAMNSGLHGTTMAPKKKPYMNARRRGFPATGTRALGRYLPTSTSNINSKLMTINIINATGETIPITLVSDASRKVVNTNPSRNMNNITPDAIIRPNLTSNFLSGSLPGNWVERYAKKPGYRGNTQRAVIGVSNPRINDVERSARKLTISTSFGYFLF